MFVDTASRMLKYKLTNEIPRGTLAEKKWNAECARYYAEPAPEKKRVAKRQRYVRRSISFLHGSLDCLILVTFVQ